MQIQFCREKKTDLRFFLNFFLFYYHKKRCFFSSFFSIFQCFVSSNLFLPINFFLMIYCYSDWNALKTEFIGISFVSNIMEHWSRGWRWLKNLQNKNQKLKEKIIKIKGKKNTCLFVLFRCLFFVSEQKMLFSLKVIIF